MLHLPADRALVDAEPLREHRRPLRALGREVGEHQVRRGLEVGVNGPRALADHPLDAPDEDADLLLEAAELVSARHGFPPSRPPARRRGATSSSRRIVVRSGTSRMNRTQPAPRPRTAGRPGRGDRSRRRTPAGRAAHRRRQRGEVGDVVALVAARRQPIWPGRWSPAVETWWLSTAPSAATPTEPPRLRKNATSELAAPMSAWAALFCTESTRFCMWRRARARAPPCRRRAPTAGSPRRSASSATPTRRRPCRPPGSASRCRCG